MKKPYIFFLIFSFISLSCNDLFFDNPLDPEAVIAPPTQPAGPVPANAESEQPTDIMLSWNCSSPNKDKLFFDVYIDRNNPPMKVAASSIEENKYKPSGLYNNTTFYWKIIARDNHKNIVESPVWQFTTMGRVPKVPILRSPLLNTQEMPVVLDLKWSRSDSSTGYNLEVYTDSAMDKPSTAIYSKTGITDTVHQINGLKNLTWYYWRVRAENKYGPSAWSAKSSFQTTGTIPAPPMRQ